MKLPPMAPFKNLAKPEKKAFAAEMRRNPTAQEFRFWEAVKDKKLGCRFRRQVIFLGWILDFWCPALRLAFEIDGRCHNKEKDAYRDRKIFEKRGVRTIRFTNDQINKMSIPQIRRAVREAMTNSLYGPLMKPSISTSNLPTASNQEATWIGEIYSPWD